MRRQRKAPQTNRAAHIRVFTSAATAMPPAHDALLLPEWSDTDWNKLFDCTRPQPYRAGELVIQRGTSDRTLFFVAAGSLEVGVIQVNRVTIAPLAKITAGSVIGEQSFFDGQVRSINVWAVSDGELLRLEFGEFSRFSQDSPALARDLLFALARVLSSRLRNTTYRVQR